jgi:hypothetical protein
MPLHFLQQKFPCLPAAAATVGIAKVPNPAEITHLLL